MKNCTCGNYYSYGEHIRRPRNGLLVSTVIAHLMPHDNCYNCYLIKTCGTTDPEEIKKIRVERARERLERRKDYRSKAVRVE